MTETFRYVRHASVPAYKQLGWALAGSMDECHHGYYGLIMKWEGDGEPVEPSK